MKRRTFIQITFTFFTIQYLCPQATNAKESILLEIDKKAPFFNLPGTSISEPERNYWDLNSFIGSWLVLYFYPSDFTNGCTLEARSFSEMQNQFSDSGIKLVGISADNLLTHKSFCLREKLNFPLLTDNHGEVSKRYNSWNAPYSARNTFLIDPNGNLRLIMKSVKPLRHAQHVYSTLSDLIDQ